MNAVCDICGAPLGQYDRLCARCCMNLLADPETAEDVDRGAWTVDRKENSSVHGSRSTVHDDDPEPVYILRRQFSPHQAATVRGTDGLLARVPKLDPDIYEILTDGAVWGTATVLSDGDWEIDSPHFKAGPGYLIV